MPQRLHHFRATLTAVLVTVLLTAAFSGAMASARLESSGLHAHYPEERICVHKAGDVRAVAGERPTSTDGAGGATASPRPLVVALFAGPTASCAPNDWTKVASGLVPLPLRI